jgi:hypothetical protein
MGKTAIRVIAALTALTFSSATLSQTPTPPAPLTPPLPPQQEAEGKFAWGLLIKLIAPTVFQLFANWVMKKIEPTYDEKALRKLAVNVAGAGIVKIGTLFASKDIILAGVEPNAALGEPLDELRNDASGENYQGVHVALVEVDANGAPIGFRTVADGFSTGERFKLRVLSTFDALVVLGNITPKGKQRQIYPAAAGEAVRIPAGTEVLLPLGQKQYLQFVGDVGRDQITITVRDPRSLETGQASTARVFRKDEAFGSNFLQEVKPGLYPVIAEAISIQHR